MGKGGKRGGGHAKYAESITERFNRIETTVSTLERLSLAHIMANNADEVRDAKQNMQEALHMTMEERAMRQTYKTQREELDALKVQVENGRQAEKKMAAVEIAITYTEGFFSSPDPEPQPGAQPAYDSYSADPDQVVEAPQALAQSSETNRQMMNKLSNPMH